MGRIIFIEEVKTWRLEKFHFFIIFSMASINSTRPTKASALTFGLIKSTD